MEARMFVKDVMRTVNPVLTDNEHITNAALGLTGEAGEVAEIVKKAMYQGHSLDKLKILEELGDVLFYVAYMAELNGYTFDQLFSYNVTKRRARYPEGFSIEKSIERRGLNEVGI